MAGGGAAEQISVARLRAAQPHRAETELSPAVPPAWGRDTSITGPQAQATWKCTASVTCPNCGENSPPDATLLAMGSRAQLLPSSTSRMEPMPSGGHKNGFPLPSGGPPQEFCNVPQLCRGEGRGTDMPGDAESRRVAFWKLSAEWALPRPDYTVSSVQSQRVG